LAHRQRLFCQGDRFRNRKRPSKTAGRSRSAWRLGNGDFTARADGEARSCNRIV